MLHLAIPVRDEAPTIGVLLWRIRQVLREFSREFQVVVYDDGSTDATREVLAPYHEVMPLTVLGHREPRGYAHALDTLLRHVATTGRYARRDAMILMQGDLTDRPEDLPELVKRFEGGADCVGAARARDLAAPVAVQRLARVGPWVLKPFVSLPAALDPFGTYRALRVSVVKDLVREAGEAPVVRGEGWAANVDLLLATARHTRRLEAVTLARRWDLRPRPTRVRPWPDALALFRYGRGARRRPAPAAGVPAPAAAR
ncbi:MAG: glycosyltransferase family 2 protein [Gemmatimonadaceae bacterium]|nr:glycosyltransferase family 2 protein [Gemmatimonadaceae bacterium]